MSKISTLQLRLLILTALLLAPALWLPVLGAEAAADSLTTLPADARIWHNRSGQADADYAEMVGPDVAFVNNAWYYLDGSGPWRRFHTGPILDFNQVDERYTGALKYEVISGTVFFENGTPDMYGMVLHGPSGNLVLANGTAFDPSDFELLIAGDGKYYFYHAGSDIWWMLNQPGKARTSAPPPDYRPVRLSPGTFPDRALFGASPQQSLKFDPQTKRFLHLDGGRVAAFHSSIAGSQRRWDNRSGQPGSGYSEMSGPDILFVDSRWYAVEDETHFRPFHSGRYLDIADAYDVNLEGLAYEVTVGAGIEPDGPPTQLGLRLDGVTGQLLGADGQPVAAPAEEPPVSLLLRDPLVLQGVAPSPAATERGRKNDHKRVRLLRVVPLRYAENDPFNDATLPLAINSARVRGGPVVTPPTTPPVTPPAPPPVPGSCPLNTPLIVNITLPDSVPGAQLIQLLGVPPVELAVGLDATTMLEIGVPYGGSDTQGMVIVGNGFTYLSGSPIGTVSAGSNLTYLLRRDMDNAEVEVSLRFSVGTVFDTWGVTIEALSGRLCQLGGAL